MPAPRHVYQTFIHATPERVWQALTDPAFTSRYFYGTAIETSLEPGSGFRYVMPDGSGAVDGTIEVAEPPSRLVMTWHILYDTECAAEPPSRVEWLLTPSGDGITKVTTVHGDLGMSPHTWASVRDGWVWVIDGMKTLLETGAPMRADATTREVLAVPAGDDPEGQWHRTEAVAVNNSIWELLDRDDLTVDEGEDLLRRAYAAAYHWARAVDRGPEHEARAEYMIAKAYLKLERADDALRHASRCLATTTQAALGDFDLAYAHEVVARALQLSGDEAGSLESWKAAKAVPIADPEDQAILDGDFAGAPI
jgi:uncharacterized protein YndB with AHSA1/START domain